MAYKRQIDRLPIIPADAKRHNATCHSCTVGCGYHAYNWPINKQGGTAPGENVLVSISPSSKARIPMLGMRRRFARS